MSARTRAALMWGVIAGLAFLVLAEGYHLAGGRLLTVPVGAGVALVVTAGGTALAYLAEGWLARRGASDERDR